MAAAGEPVDGAQATRPRSRDRRLHRLLRRDRDGERHRSPSLLPSRRGYTAAARAQPEPCLLWSLPADLHFAIPNGLMRSKKAAARAQGEGVRAGVPDLCVIHRGRPIFIELKTAKGARNDGQHHVVDRDAELLAGGLDVSEFERAAGEGSAG
jgi:hypothetical protein